MRVITTLVAAASLSAAATAQDYGWIIEVENPTLAPLGHASGLPQETEIRVYAKFDGTVHYAMGAGEFDLVANEVGMAHVNWHSNELLLPLDFGDGRGTPTDTGAVGMQPGQLFFSGLGIFPDPINPAPAWRITYTATSFTPREIDLVTVSGRFRVYDEFGVSHLIPVASLMEGAGRITIIPAPGSLALLGLAGLAVVRRRR